MAWTSAETQRIVTLEEAINTLQVVVTNLANKEQLRQLMALKQGEIDALTERVASLEAQLAVLQSRLD